MRDDTRSTYALLSRAARTIQANADSLRACHSTRGDWGSDHQAQQIYDQEVGTAAALRALVRVPKAGPPRLPEGAVLVHLARVVGLREAMHGVDTATAKNLLWRFLVAALASMDDSDVVNAELSVGDYADDLAVAERAFRPIGRRRG